MVSVSRLESKQESSDTSSVILTKKKKGRPNLKLNIGFKKDSAGYKDNSFIPEKGSIAE